jgi:hypothetical protein
MGIAGDMTNEDFKIDLEVLHFIAAKKIDRPLLS